MAAKTPVAFGGTAYADPRRSLWGGSNTDVPGSGLALPREGKEHHVYRFADIDNGDTWDTGRSDIFAVAWQCDASTDQVGAVAQPGTTTVAFGTSGAGTNHSGWLHIWFGG